MTSSSIETRPSFATERLRAEPVELRHAEVMIGVLNDPEIYRFLSDDPPTLTQLQCQYRFLMGGKSPDGLEHWLTWILIPHEQPAEPAGFVQATIREPESAHVAYVLSRKHWGMRYGSEALLALLDVVFTRYDVERAVAEMDTRNDASIALVRSLGFRHVCTLNDVTELKGTMSHEHVYELQRSDWSRLKG
jgi:ribosomal-protein-alanine N-acetyltransferase